VVQTQEMVKEKIKPLPPDQQEKALADIAATLQATMPPRENPRKACELDGRDSDRHGVTIDQRSAPFAARRPPAPRP